MNQSGIKVILILFFLIMSLTAVAGDNFDDQRPDGINDQKWSGLKSAVHKAKLLPSPAGVGGEESQFGHSVSLDGNRALVGAPNMMDNGLVFVFDFDGYVWHETAQLQAADGAPEDGFGYSVSLSGDRALIGAPYNDVTQYNSGSAYVFDFNGSDWHQTAKLIPSNVLTIDFGAVVSLSGDRALITATDDGSSDYFGWVFVFDFNGTAWSETTKLVASDGVRYDYFGRSHSLDGNRALIGAPGVNNSSGSVYVFDFDINNLIWNETAKFTADDVDTFDDFGNSVSLSGNRALIGSLKSDGTSNASGSAYVFDFNGNSWSETAKLSASDGAFYDHFGSSVSLFGDRALIGARGVGGPSNLYGAAYVFDFNGSVWNETVKLTASDASTYHLFGTSVSLFGNRALIGAPGDGDLGTYSGAVYVYDFNGSSWIETVKLIASDGIDYARFGSSVNLSGNRALVGAYGDDDAGGNTGSAYIFDFNGTLWEESAKLSASDQAGGERFGISVSLSGNRALIGAYNDNDIGVHSGSAYVFDYDGSFWNESTKLTATDGSEFDTFGSSVSLSGNLALIGAPYADGAAIDSGSAYVFDFDGSLWNQTMKLTANDGTELDYFGGSVSLSGDYALIGSPMDDVHGTNSGSAYVFIVKDLIFRDGFDGP